MAEAEFGISGGGHDAEERFRRLTGAQRAPKAALGLDAERTKTRATPAESERMLAAVWSGRHAP
jgi:hypothetical protein